MRSKGHHYKKDEICVMRGSCPEGDLKRTSYVITADYVRHCGLKSDRIHCLESESVI
jgi:hypothetical protein